MPCKKENKYLKQAYKELKGKNFVILSVSIDRPKDKDAWDGHTIFLFDKINFLMDATVGFININQNKIIKLFSVASVALLPPTLVASVYGMNFKHMPELDWKYGYAWGILLMVASAALPMLYFRRRGWLK